VQRITEVTIVDVEPLPNSGIWSVAVAVDVPNCLFEAGLIDADATR
jgi:hypothetical protein